MLRSRVDRIRSYLGRISAVSRLYLVCISAVSRLYLADLGSTRLRLTLTRWATLCCMYSLRMGTSRRDVIGYLYDRLPLWPAFMISAALDITPCCCVGIQAGR